MLSLWLLCVLNASHFSVDVLLAFLFLQNQWFKAYANDYAESPWILTYIYLAEVLNSYTQSSHILQTWHTSSPTTFLPAQIKFEHASVVPKWLPFLNHLVLPQVFFSLVSRCLCSSHFHWQLGHLDSRTVSRFVFQPDGRLRLRRFGILALTPKPTCFFIHSSCFRITETSFSLKNKTRCVRALV